MLQSHTDSLEKMLTQQIKHVKSGIAEFKTKIQDLFNKIDKDQRIIQNLKEFITKVDSSRSYQFVEVSKKIWYLEDAFEIKLRNIASKTSNYQKDGSSLILNTINECKQERLNQGEEIIKITNKSISSNMCRGYPGKIRSISQGPTEKSKYFLGEKKFCERIFKNDPK